jgi:hypothetical protein
MRLAIADMNNLHGDYKIDKSITIDDLSNPYLFLDLVAGAAQEAFGFIAMSA